MTDDAEDEERVQTGGLLRLATLVIGGVEIILFVLFAHLMLQSTDPLSAEIGEGMTAVVAVPLVMMTLPGLLLAWLDRAPKVALSLVLLALPAAGVAWSHA
jgi:preprotein translocase subunit SecY